MNNKLKIAIVTDWVAEKMGYIETELASEFGRLGHEVFLISGNVRPYFNTEFYSKVYESYLGPPEFEPGTYANEYYTLHALQYQKFHNGIILSGLGHLLNEIKPDIVQCFDMCSHSTIQIVLTKIRYSLKFKLFTACHMVDSVFPPSADDATFATKASYFARFYLRGRFINSFMEKCYPATIDAARIAKNYYGVSEHKCSMHPLGVNVRLFEKYSEKKHYKFRKKIRDELKLNKDDILCIYTGRFVDDKRPHILAKAMSLLADQHPNIKSLFVGKGDMDITSIIASSPNCFIHDFVNSGKLPEFYYASDIGVWPAQESLSMLDAASVGLPVIVSNQLKAKERYEGNGITYKQDDPLSLADAILSLAKDVNMRKQLGCAGAKKIRKHFSWSVMAKRKIDDYYDSLKANHSKKS